MFVILDKAFEGLSGLVGVPPDHLKLFFALLTSYPLSIIHLRLPSPTHKHLLSILTSAFYMVGLFNMKWGMIQLLGDAVGVWGLCVSDWAGSKQGVRGEKGKVGWLVFWAVMGHLTINHAYRALASIPPSTIEITAMQMVLAMKLITFAWNVEDGRDEDPDLDPYLRATSIPPSQFPDLLSFLGYAFFFPSFLIGPASDYVTYKALVEGTIFTFPPGGDEGNRGLGRENRGRVEGTGAGEGGKGLVGQGTEDVDIAKVTKDSLLDQTHPLPNSTSTPNPTSTSTRTSTLLLPLGRKTASTKKLTTGLIFLAVYSLLGSQFDYAHIVGEKGWWAGKGWVGRWGWVMVAAFVARTKYYAIWSLSEGACILSGIGFNGYTKTHDGRQVELWNRVENIDIYNIETAQSFKVLFDSWNCRANVWLRDTIYKRLAKKGKKPGFKSTVMTFVTSAFWHGIAPGYYMAFITAGICTSLGRSVRQLLRPLAVLNPTHKYIYDILGLIVVQSTLAYFVTAFMLLTFRDTIVGWWRMGFVGHLGMGVVWAGIRLGGGWMRGEQRRRGVEVKGKGGGKKVQ